MTDDHGFSPNAPTKPSDTGQVAQKLWPYFDPYKWRLGAIALVLVAATLVDMAGPYLIGVAVDQFIDPTNQVAPAWLVLLVGPDVERRVGLAIVMALLALTYAVGWGMSVLLFRLMVRMSQKILLTMRTQIFDQIQRLSLSFFDQHEAGDLMSRLVNDTQVINDMFGPGLAQMLRGLLSLVGILVAMVALNWRLAVASFAVLPLFLVATLFFVRRVRIAFRQTRKTIGEVSAELQENIAGVREVQAFSREDESLQEFEAVNARNRSANIQAETLSSAFQPTLEVLSTVGVAAVTGYGGYLVIAYSPPLVSIGVIVAFLTYVRRFYQPIAELAQLFGQLQSAIAGAERIFELLDTEPEITTALDAVEPGTLTGRIEYRNVSFRYTDEEPVLEDVSLTIEPEQTVALVGPTGSGKTTIVNLLIRNYDTQAGSILVDGHDLRTVDIASLRQQIGVVPQDTFLFSGTVMDNIRYGRLEASDEEVIEAAKTANAHSFIERMPQGYQTEIGERGANLSHGNRQLLAIARAILKDPRILILDEATSSVDTRTELLIQHGLAQLLKRRTSLIIAHRLSTIRNADLILVLKDGRVVERGTHNELLALRGLYHNLYMSQFRRQETIAPTELVSRVKPEMGTS